MRIADSMYLEKDNMTAVFCMGSDITPSTRFRRVEIDGKKYRAVKCGVYESISGHLTLSFGVRGKWQFPRVEINPV